MNYNQKSASNYSIVKLVSWQKWFNLEDVLQVNDEGNDQQVVFDDRAKNQLPEEHILHLACQHQAPFRIIELLAKKYPTSACTPEKKGRFPIHIACAKGLKPKTIDFLIKAHPQATGVQDDFGKTPLHYACESYCVNYKIIPSNAYRSPDESVCFVVALLLDQEPTLANVEDLYGMNSIEYAIDSGTAIKVIKMMQTASRENWRSLQQRNRGMSHEDLRQSIHSLSSSLNSLDLSSENLEELEATANQDRLLRRRRGEGESKMADDDNRQLCNALRSIEGIEKKVHAARTA